MVHQMSISNNHSGMTKGVPSNKYPKLTYTLQKELKKGYDGTAWLAKRKEEEIMPSGKKLAAKRLYFCIK